MSIPRNSAEHQEDTIPQDQRTLVVLEEALNLDDELIYKKLNKDNFLEETETKEVMVQVNPQSPLTSRFNKVFSSIKNGDDIRTISIPGYHTSGDVVYYEVVVSNSKLRWNVWIRFDSFTILHLLLKDLAKELEDDEHKFTLPPMPDKHLKVLIDHFSQEFVENRRALLENYLQKINKNRTLRHAEDFIHFLLPPREVEPTSPLGTRANPLPMDYDTEDEKRSEPPSTRVKLILDNSLDESSNVKNHPLPKFMSAESDMLFVSEKDEITGVEIKSATLLEGDQNTDAHAIYHVHVRNVNKENDYNIWIVMKRFMEFVEFDRQLRESLLNTHPADVFQLPHLPPKLIKSWTNHKDVVFIEKRRVLLQVYLRRMIRYPLFRRHPLTLAFLGVRGRSVSSSMGSEVE